MKIKTKKRKKWGNVYRKIGITQRLDIEDTKQIRVVEIKKLQIYKYYEGSNILLLESGAHSRFLQICIAFFTIYGGSNIW